MACEPTLFTASISKPTIVHMDLRQLRYFVEAARQKNLTAASQKLNVTAQALGQQIKNLELELGAMLFERHSRGIEPTAAGQMLLGHASDILERADLARTQLRKLSGGSMETVSIGVTPSLGKVFVPRMLDECASRFPSLKLNFVQGYADHLEQMISDHLLDIAFVHSQIDNTRLVSQPLIVETIHLIGTAGLLREVNEPVPVSFLPGIPLILDGKGQLTRRVIENVLGDVQSLNETAIEIQSVSMRREFVIQGRYCLLSPIGLFFEEIASGHLISKKIDHKYFTRILGVASVKPEVAGHDIGSILNCISEIITSIANNEKYGWKMSENGWNID